MNRETREARPFRIPEPAEGVFDAAVLRFGGKTCEADSRLLWEASESYAQQPVVLEWCPETGFDGFRGKLRQAAAELEGVWGKPAPLALMVTVTSRYLSLMDRVFEHRLDRLDSLERILDLGSGERRPAGLRTGSRGGRVDAYLLLDERAPKKVLSPWRKGTWLPRVRFTIATEYAKDLFRPRPLTAAGRKELGLTPEAVRHVRFHESTWEQNDPEPPELYLDSDLYDEFANRPKAPISRSMQTELAGFFLRAVLTDACGNRGEWEDREWGELRDSLLGRVVRTIAGKKAPVRRCEDWLNELRYGNLEKTISAAEGAIGMRSVMLEAIRDRA